MRFPTSRLHVHKTSASVLSQENLNETMSDDFVKRPKFLVRFKHRIRIVQIRRARTRLKRPRRLVDDWVGDRLTGNLPQRNEAVNGRWKAHPEDTVIGRSARRLEVQIKWPAIFVHA